MRLHRLRLTAFGSFPGEEEVDFDALGASGLFLVHGPTGAGKTTVLDAICFALYGRVPGHRDNARSLRCDHAPPERGPSVELEFTLRGRRLRVTRSPAWQRPKLRGEGFVEEKPKVIVSELVNGEWVGRTRRLDEAGHLLGDLLGMSAEQFWQVVMLPQGDFARFLRATGDERGRLLRHLFSVQVFTDAENWLAEHRTRMGRERQELAHAVEVIVRRMEEAAGEHLLAHPGEAAAEPGTVSDAAPAGMSADAASGTLFDIAPGTPVGAVPAAAAGPVRKEAHVLADPAEDPLGWADGLIARAAALAAEAGEVCAARETSAQEAWRRLDAARALADRQRRYADALARRAALEEAAAERAELEAVLDAAARADRVRPLADAVTVRAEAATKAARVAADALARIPVPDPDAPGGGDGAGAERPAPDPEWLATLERRRRDEIARLDGLRAEEERLRTLRAEHEALEKDLAGWTGREREITDRLAVLPERRRRAEEELNAARIAAARLPGAEAACARAAELAAAVTALGRARAALPYGVGEGADALTRAERERRDEIARLAALGEDEERLAEVERRLAELAAEAEGLAVRRDAARAALEGLPERLAEATAALDAARGEAARVPAGQAAVDAARARLEAVLRRDALARELADAERERRAATDRAQELRERLLEIRQARIEGMAAELARHLVPGEPCAVCGSTEHPAPAAAAAAGPSADDEAAAQERYEVADRARGEAERRCAVLAGDLETARAAAGEASEAEARDALERAEAEVARLRDAAEREPGLAARADELRRELEAIEHALREADRELAEHETRRAALAGERDRLAARLEAARGEDDSVRARRDRLAAEAELIRAAIDAADRAGQARAAYRAARAGIDDELAAALDHGLAEVEAATGDGEAAPRDATARAGNLAAQDADGAATAWAGTAADGVADGAPGDDLSGGVGAGAGTAALGAVPEPAGLDADPVDRALGALPGTGMAAARAILARLRASAAREPELAAEAERLAAEAERLAAEMTELTQRIAAGAARRDELAADIDRIGALVAEARGADATLAARLDRLTEEADLLREAAEAATLAVTADAELAAARLQAEQAAREAGFASLAEAEAAARPPQEREAMAERLRELDGERIAVTRLLQDPELVAAAAEPEPDLAALEAAWQAAADDHQAAVSARDEAARRHERLVALRGELDEAWGRLRPAQERYELAKRMAELVGGTSPDNPHHIRLSSYVLGERLRQVVDAANERLEHMSAGRYLLLHDLRRAAGDRRRTGGGLGLRVLDGWTGVDRDPATLSGGESFICALALALGLADVVAAEAGGVEIGTLFVDEGFGTLDEDTLDGVLDILDELRSGGRTVGIVSHVAELRTRIKARLQVDKGRTGSTLRVIAAA
jgi:exonuclease SbcC